jgi:hypothetical protein
VSGAGESEPAEAHADQPEHQGRSTADYSISGAWTTGGHG